MTKNTFIKYGLAFVIAMIVVIADQYTKMLLLERMHERIDVLVICDYFNLVNYKNYGISFGAFNDPQTNKHIWIGLSLVISSFLVYLLHKPMSKSHFIAYTMVIGGAVGNVIDRIMHGAVVDFIQVHYQKWYYPAFNLADAVICIGVALLLFTKSEGNTLSKR